MLNENIASPPLFFSSSSIFILCSSIKLVGTLSIGAFTDLDMDNTSPTTIHPIDTILHHHQTSIDIINTTLSSQVSTLIYQQSDIAEIKSTLRQLFQTLAEISSKLSSYPPPPQYVFAAPLQSQPDSPIHPPSLTPFTSLLSKTQNPTSLIHGQVANNLINKTNFASPLSKIDNPTNHNYGIDISSTSVLSKTTISNNIETFNPAIITPSKTILPAMAPLFPHLLTPPSQSRSATPPQILVQSLQTSLSYIPLETQNQQLQFIPTNPTHFNQQQRQQPQSKQFQPAAPQTLPTNPRAQLQQSPLSPASSTLPPATAASSATPSFPLISNRPDSTQSALHLNSTSSSSSALSLSTMPRSPLSSLFQQTITIPTYKISILFFHAHCYSWPSPSTLHHSPNDNPKRTNSSFNATYTTDPISWTKFDSTFNVVFPTSITMPPHIGNNRSSHTHFPINEQDHTKVPRSNPKPLDTYDIFILDFQTHDIVSTLIHAKDLRNHDIALYFPIDNSNYKQIASNIFNQLKQSFCLNFILPPLRSFLEKLTSDMARSNLMTNGSKTQSGYFYDLDTKSIDFGLNNLEQRFDFDCKRGWPTFSGDETVFFHERGDVKWWSFSQVVLMEMETLATSRDGKRIALNQSTTDKALLFVFNYSIHLMGLHSTLDPAKSSLSIKTLRKNILFNFDPGGKINLGSLFVAWLIHSDTQLYHNSDITTSTSKAPTYDLEDKVDFEGSVMIRLLIHMQLDPGALFINQQDIKAKAAINTN